jgi:ABC-type phosphate transport system substrate-binding protein
MRIPRTCRISALTLGFILTTTLSGLTAEKITVDGSTGVMPLVTGLAKVHQERHPAVILLRKRHPLPPSPSS